jgi:hypothetical protein
MTFIIIIILFRLQSYVDKQDCKTEHNSRLEENLLYAFNGQSRFVPFRNQLLMERN